jgi:carboxyl-terminal processing protease
MGGIFWRAFIPVRDQNEEYLEYGHINSDSYYGIKGMGKRILRISLTVIATLAITIALTHCASTSKELSLTPDERQHNIESFEYIWSTIRDKHYDPEFGGLDWQAVHDELRPKIEHASTTSEARIIMHDMISRLNLSHFNIIPASIYENIDRPGVKGFEGGVTGIDVRVINGHALITRVEKNSPAAAAGVKTGWEIIRVGDDDIISKLQSIAKEFENASYKDLMLASAVKSRLAGKIGDAVAVQFLNDADQIVRLDIRLTEEKGKRFKLGHFPSFYVWIEVDTIDENIGYIAFNGFFDPVYVMSTFNNAMRSFMGSDGIIIDIRGNLGGIIAMSMGMAGWLVPKKNQYLGTMYLRDNELKFVINPRSPTYTGPVAILVDGLSTSCSEIFAGGLRDLGRARLFGSRTGGAALPSTIEKLPNGDGFQYAFASYRSKSGKVLEGAGVIPDEVVIPTRESLLQGRDLVLEAAVAWIRSKK